jgi:hypothetical protein
MSLSELANGVAASTDGYSTSVTLNTTGADFIAVSVSWVPSSFSGTIIDPTFTDSEGNTWEQVGTGAATGFAKQLWYYCFNPMTSATHTFSAVGTSGASTNCFPIIAAIAIAGVTVVGIPPINGNVVSFTTSLTNYSMFGQLLLTGIANAGTSNTITGWSVAAVDFNNGISIGGGIGWLLQNPASPQAPTWSWSGSSPAASTTLSLPIYQFTRDSNTPVLLNHNQGGANVAGLQPDAWAAPSACWNGSQWVGTFSLWNIAAQLWYSLFFTSPDLRTWTYIANSLQSPSGSDYIIGNSGIAYFNGKYFWCYQHYPNGTSLTLTALAYSTDLTSGGTPTWTIVGDPIINNTVSANDPTLMINPSTGNLELWSVTPASLSGRTLQMAVSSDGLTWPSTWTTVSDFFTEVSSPPYGLGASAPWYSNSVGFVSHDQILGGIGTPRSIGMLAGTGLLTYSSTPILQSDASLAWQDVQVFDSFQLGPVDPSSGPGGSTLWMLYAGGTNDSAADDTDSCIGLAWMADPTQEESVVGSGAGIIQGTASIVANSIHTGVGQIQGSTTIIASSITSGSSGINASAIGSVTTNLVAAEGIIHGVPSIVASSLVVGSASITAAVLIVTSSVTIGEGGIQAAPTFTTSSLITSEGSISVSAVCTVSGATGEGQITTTAMVVASSVASGIGEIQVSATYSTSSLTGVEGAIQSNVTVIVPSSLVATSGGVSTSVVCSIVNTMTAIVSTAVQFVYVRPQLVQFVYIRSQEVDFG